MIIQWIIKKLKINNSKIRILDCSQIKKIQVKDDIVEIYLHNKKAPAVLELKDVIHDESLLLTLNSCDAARIGYSYGLHLNNYQEIGMFPKLPFNFFKQSPGYLYTISMLDRLGNIYYLNLHTGEQLISTPLEICSDIKQIINFPPVQASYIGIMAGIIELKNYKQALRINVNNRTFRLVS